MTKRPRTLFATFVLQVGRPGFYGDGRGGGLSLLVERMAGTGRVSKSWCQRIRLGGKPRNLGLGASPPPAPRRDAEPARPRRRTRCGPDFVAPCIAPHRAPCLGLRGGAMEPHNPMEAAGNIAIASYR